MPYTHYTLDERNALQTMEGMGLPICYRAVILSKHPSSIYRELSRNRSGSVYTGNEAQKASVQRRLDNKPGPKLDDPALTREIMRLFKHDLSADQISGRLEVLYPEQPEKQASISTIYTCLYGETAKDPEMKEHFRQKQAKPRRRKGVKDRRGQIPDRVSIDERPKIVEEKSRVGDWEGDTIESSGKNAYIATFVDRKTKFLLAKLLPDKAAATLNRAALRAFKPIPASMRNTLTLDNGKEFAAHKSLSEALGIDIYFAHPYHSWERGLNEYTNGLIRQYLPKKIPFDTLTQKLLDKIVDKINNRPRKVLGYLTPYEVFSP
jgi:IS30 family transposase